MRIVAKSSLKRLICFGGIGWILKFRFAIPSIIAWMVLWWVPFAVLAEDGPSIKAVLFYMPESSECSEAMTATLPSLKAKYGDRLHVLAINNTVPKGGDLFLNAMMEIGIPISKRLPILIAGETYLSGSSEISERFPHLIQEELAKGGVAWPAIPGMTEILKETGNIPQSAMHVWISSGYVNRFLSIKTNAVGKFNRDPTGNSFSVAVLVGMVVSLIYIGYLFVIGSTEKLRGLSRWIIPSLSVIGFGVAGYLSYASLSHSEAVCGPVGDCNTVQGSPYAYLFGIVPVSVFGMAGYFMILAVWFLQYFGPSKWRDHSAIMVWLMALFGVMYFIYLTFLEPFVIGATCAWCLTSAIAMTLVLWTSTASAGNSLKQLYR
ncbi:MAG: vitamin K epoxide reductase family protein [Proteobacteria bacterium]|nr:vitamin K epoxide reductase family protein [Pseudomonadota bacterium]